MSPTFDPNAAAVCDGVFGLPFSEAQAGVVLIPVAFDATTSGRGGASTGPSAIRQASMQVDLYERETDSPWRFGIHMLQADPRIEDLSKRSRALALPIIEAGGMASDPAALREINQAGEYLCTWLHDLAAPLFAQRKIVGVVGGDHSTPLGAIVAAAEHYPDLGVLHIDAHADLRVAYEGFEFSHASIMHNALKRAPNLRIVQVGVRDLCDAEAQAIDGSEGRVVTFFDTEMAERMFRGHSFASVADDIISTLPQNVYVSFDIDGLDPSLCPLTGTPVPGGLSYRQATFLLAALARSGRRIIGFDLCEVVQDRDDANDGLVGAHLLYKLIGCACMSQSPPLPIAPLT